MYAHGLAACLSSRCTPAGSAAIPPAACRTGIDRIEPRLGGRAFQLTLYYESGLKLSIEENGRPLGGYALGEGETGTLNVVELGGASYVAVHTQGRHSERLLLLNAGMEEALDVSAAAVRIEGGAVEAIDPLGTLLGHERRVRYQYEIGEGFVAAPAEIGFFTCAPRTPRGHARACRGLCRSDT